MKDSQHAVDGCDTVVKYIKVNNERFSTRRERGDGEG